MKVEQAVILSNEPCTWRSAPHDLITEVCANCGHTMLVHGGHPNPSLEACAICTVLDAAIRLEQRRSPVFEMKITESERDNLLAQVRHEPIPEAAQSRCRICHAALIADASGKNWAHPDPGDG